MSTLGKIMHMASVILDDQASVRVTPMQLRMFVNEGQREVARRSECLRTKTDVPVVAGTSSTIVPLPIVRISEIYFHATGDTHTIPLVYRDHRANRTVWGSGRDVGSGTPEIFWTEGFPGDTSFTVNLFPKPFRAGTLEIHYYRFPTDFALDGSDDDQPIDLPSGWSDTLTPFVVMRGMEAQRQYEAAGLYRDEFSQKLAALVEASVRFVNEPGTVMMDDWYDIFGDGWE